MLERYRDDGAKGAYLSGMATFLAGARSYLFGRSDGCVRNSTVAGVACGSTDKIEATAAHIPYTFVVPNFTSSAYNGDATVTTGTGAYYYPPLSSALATYRDGVLASSASPLHRALQLAGIAKFDTDTSAIVTTRVKRSGAYGATCAVP